MKATNHPSRKFVKLMFIGDSGTGKTGALVSLIKAGYNLRVLDLDNGLDALLQQIAKQDPKGLDRLDYITIRDKMSSSGNPAMPARISGDAYSKAVKVLNKWDDDSIPAEWGEKAVFCLDSLTHLGRSAFYWARAQNPTIKDPRQWFFTAQQSIEFVLGLLTSDAFATNVIVITHINYKELGERTTGGDNKVYPSSIGKALGPIIGTYFNTMVQAETSGSGTSIKRTIRIVPSPTLDLKIPAPHKFEGGTLDLNTGLAELFEKLKTL